MDSRVRILWISDLHWSSAYESLYCSNSENFCLFLNSFLENIKNCQKEKEIDYLIITGDLSQKGDSDEYNQVYTYLIEKISTNSNIPIICVPGNHDIDRKVIQGKSELLVDFITHVKKDTITFEDVIGKRHFREYFFSEHKDEFEKMFDSYTAFAKSKFFINRQNIEYSESFKNSALYGLTIDYKNRIIFISVNSSWYSFGEELLKYFINNGLLNSSEEVDDLITKIALITNEYGKQILGLDIIEGIKEILNILNEYPDFITILLMHHPINWLIPQDQIPHQDFLFPQIMNKVDLILTGHEHVLSQQPIKILNNQRSLHLEAGELITYSKNASDFKPGNNWFSILDINVTKKTLLQDRISFNASSNKWESSRKEIYKLNKKYRIAFSSKRRELLAANIKKHTFSFLKTFFGNEEIERYDNTFYRDKKNNLYILQTDEDVNVSFSIVLNTIELTKLNVVKIFFVFVDIFHKLATDYSLPENDRIETLTKIKHDYDIKFDNLRYKFFANLNIEQAIKYKNLMFISKIIPFWEIEHINLENE